MRLPSIARLVDISAPACRLALTLWGLLAAPVLVGAQEVALTGTVMDTTGAVLPGVTLTAVHTDTGNSFVGVSDAAGAYRIGGLRVGIYSVTAALAGFSTVTQENVELRVGQRGILDFKLSVSVVQESVTVTGETPLVVLSQSKLGGGLDPRQVEALPLNGRNWLQLTMLTPGARTNSVENIPTEGFGQRTEAGFFQVNLDGQQVTYSSSTGTGFPNPRFSREAIAEFEMITSRFDATQGRASGVQVNAVTKAGSNSFAGTLSGYFRDDSLNAPDLVVNRVLKYSNQQIGGTFGGPIRHNRAHFFGYYEYEREPQTAVFTSPYPQFNIPDLTETREQRLVGARFDVQRGNMHVMVRGNMWWHDMPIQTTPGATMHPSRLNFVDHRSGQAFMSLSQALGSSSLNEIKIGYTDTHGLQDATYVKNTPTIALRGYTIGKSTSQPLFIGSRNVQVRDDFTVVRGHHEMKIGAEYLHPRSYLNWQNFVHGNIDATLGPVPANIEALFPVWNDPSTWNLAPLSSITRSYSQGVGDPIVGAVEPSVGAWFQDNWTVTPRLTLNLGVRWDLQVDGLAQDIAFPPFRSTTGQEWTNFGPRLGFAYRVGADNKTVIRGGVGKYYGSVLQNYNHNLKINTQSFTVEVLNDGRPNFAADPWNIAGGGHVPTVDEAVMQRRNIFPPGVPDESIKHPYTYQTSIGLQRQVGQTMAFQADYVWTSGHNEGYPINAGGRNINLSFDPSTGVNLPFTNISTRPYPDWGIVGMRFSDSHSNYHGLETGFTKRFSNNWQASGTYTLSRQRDYLPPPPGVTFPVAKDLGGDYTLSVADQRHRAVFTGIWEMRYGFQLSGLYFFGSGARFNTDYGGDLRNSGGLSTRLRPDGTIVPRNNLVGHPLHRVDLRIQKRVRFGRVTADGILEVFNVFNHANYGTYVTSEANSLYGQPVQNVNVAYQPRMGQIGFRVAF